MVFTSKVYISKPHAIDSLVKDLGKKSFNHPTPHPGNMGKMTSGGRDMREPVPKVYTQES